jgi:hypothetical protein
MSTLSLDPGSHPQRRAALAAHALREALEAIGLLDQVPECVGAVKDGQAVVRLGDIDATAALALATQLNGNPRTTTRRRPAKDQGEGGELS